MGWQTWKMAGCCWCWNLQPRHPPDPGGQSQDCQRLLSPLHQGLTRADRQPYLTYVRRGGGYNYCLEIYQQSVFIIVIETYFTL